MNKFSLYVCRSSSTNHKGFTLIEVMVAVAILAMALPAMMYALGNQLDNVGYLRDKMFAQWVAENVLADMRLENKITGRIATTKQQGEQDMAGRTWYWRSEAKAFEQDGFKDIWGVNVAVFADKSDKDEQALFRMTGIMRQYLMIAVKRPEASDATAGGNQNTSPNTSGGDATPASAGED